MKKTGVIIFIFKLTVGIVFNAHAQQDSAQKAYYKLRNQYVTNLVRKINVTALLVAVGNGFELRGKENIRFRPNETGNIGIRLSHNWVSIGFSYGIKNLQRENRGETKLFNFVVNTYGKSIGFDAYFLSYKGHYISKAPVLETPQFLKDKNYLSVPNLNTLFIGTNAYYIFNHKKFSFRSAFLRNEIQKKSAGSFILMASYSFYQIKSDTGFLPDGFKNSISADAQLVKGNFNSISLMPTYAYTYANKHKFFITLSPSVGIMFQRQFYSTIINQQPESDIKIRPRILFRAGIGHNAAKWYYGINTLIDNYLVPLPQGNTLIYNIGNANLYVGYRFNVPKKFRKLSNTIEEYSPSNMLDELKEK